MAMVTRSGAAPHSLSRYSHAGGNSVYQDDFASPTESDFSDAYNTHDDVVSWDESRVASWLRSIGAERYVQNFRDHHVTGEVLIDIDQDALKDMGIKRIGDRVRINSQIKMFRHKDYRSKRNTNRDSFALLDNNNTVTTPSSASASPRATRSTKPPPPSRQESHQSRPRDSGYAASALHAAPNSAGSNGSRPNSPFVSDPQRAQRHGSSTNVSALGKPLETPQTARFMQGPRSINVPSSKHAAAPEPEISIPDTSPLPPHRAYARIIYDNGRASVISVEGLKTGQEIIMKAVKHGKLNEAHVSSYCFYTLDGVEARARNCRKLEAWKVHDICEYRRPERERLILRKIHAGEPDNQQLVMAATIGAAQAQRLPILHSRAQATKSQKKIQQLMGEEIPPLSYPVSPASAAMRSMDFASSMYNYEKPPEPIVSAPPPPRRRPPKPKEFTGARPPSELVVADPSTYFPDADREEIERVRRMSMRRSQRLSRATNRLSIASTISMTSSHGRGNDEAPPVPQIADSWFTSLQGVRSRPLSIFKVNRPRSSYRDSVVSSLEPLDEEASLNEPNRKSYVSMRAESLADSATVSFTDPDGNTTISSYFEDGSPAATESGNSFNEQLTQALAEDGEEPDEELNEFLTTDSWDNIKYIRGKLIGQGSFGSVYLALHAFTAELMAVKQVELPSTSGTAIDAKKNSMVEALKREIALLRELKHEHIVQYLGSSSEDNKLNIFLEYIPGGSIAKMLVDFGPFKEVMCSKLVKQILIGLAYLHSRDIIHRDIKGANVLVDNHGNVKISDFGISKRVQDSKQLLETGGNASTESLNEPRRRNAGNSAFAANRVSLQGSVFWMAPEVVKQTAYTRKADIWSLGCLIVEMLTGKHPHPNMTQLQAIFKIGGKSAGGDPSPDIPDEATPAAREMLKATFRTDYNARPEAQELLAMDFLREKK